MMLSAWSDRVGYGGLQFQVQTQCLPSEPDTQVLCQLFFGGALVSARSETLCGRPAAPLLSQVAHDLHRAFVVDLKKGAFDQEITQTPGTGEFRAVRPTPSQATSSPPSTDGAAAVPSTLDSGATRYFESGLNLFLRALREWDVAASLQPHNEVFQGLRLLPQTLLSRLWCHEQLLDLAGMADELEPLGGPNGISLDGAARRFEKGLIYFEKGELQEALIQWEVARALDPDNTSYRHNVDLLRRRMGMPVGSGGNDVTS